jgi:hypothetical protein
MCIYAHACARRYVVGHGVGAATHVHSLSRSSHKHAVRAMPNVRDRGHGTTNTKPAQRGTARGGAHARRDGEADLLQYQKLP